MALDLYGDDNQAGWHPRDRRLRIYKPDHWGLKLNAAIDAWNDCAGRVLFVREWNAADAHIVCYDDGQPWYWAELTDVDGGGDWTKHYAHNQIHMGNHNDTTSVWHILCHEMGHCLGFHHQGNNGGIMGWNPDGSDGWFNASDREDLRRIYG